MSDKRMIWILTYSSPMQSTQLIQPAICTFVPLNCQVIALLFKLVGSVAPPTRLLILFFFVGTWQIEQKVGNWWPKQICAIKNGAHGAKISGILGHSDNGVFLIVVQADGRTKESSSFVHYLGTYDNLNANRATFCTIVIGIC